MAMSKARSHGRNDWQSAVALCMSSTILTSDLNNGGKVVPLEKDAHILIADHARKDAHPDSYSWKYITESVQHGYAQLTDRYRIFGHPEAASVRVGVSTPVKRTRTPFSAADDAALANWVLAHTEGRTGNKIFQEFAETVNETKHSWHTWQSWRNRFVKSLANLPIADLEKLAMSAADLALQTTNPVSRSASSQAYSRQQEEQLPNAAVQAPGKTRKKQAARTPHRPASASPFTNPNNVQITTASIATSEQKSEKGEVGTQDAMRARFYADLLTFAEETEADLDPDPCIGGKTVDLWDLSQAVAVQKVPLEEVDWMKVAEDLNYNLVENKDVTSELRRYYEDNLAEFFEEVSSFSLNYYGELEDAQRSGPLSPENNVPSSPPRQSSNRKRSMDDHTPSTVEKSSKRRRLSRNAEIPSTPEEIVGVLTMQSPSVMKAKQLRQASSSSMKTSTSGVPSRAVDGDDDNETDDRDEVVTETQFGRVPRLEAQQSTFDVTPSQQLHSEALDVTPIPLNLRKGRDDPKEKQAESSEPAQEPEASTLKRKATNRATKRSLPASFQPAPGLLSTQQAEARARRPSAPIRVELDEEGNSQDIRECTEFYEALGYPRAIVIESLMRTTMTPGWPMISLLEKLQNEEGVPSNYEGIWTDRDDKSLRYADAIEARKSSASTRELNKAKKELDRIVHKHTQEAVDLRRRFLRAQAVMDRD
ncbi:transcription factor Rap1, putative [Metarhizium acridum CQMa 102]|uniref:DNA-binding protein RAP1 n=1 Tax=Metarhizium acridum (strain CQMa 102) TaxID=655827 RepID=E9DYN7_METAQ|nr:transcription factor Rap1, putative [Metarhizium acridum CQMa 102]EFY91307.1 transcription factor Rap1, putative [Metarhizium acridum CQMa 102]